MAWSKEQEYHPLHQDELEPATPKRLMQQRAIYPVLPLIFTHIVGFLIGSLITWLLMRTVVLVNNNDLSVHPLGAVDAKLPAYLSAFSQTLKRNGTFDFPSPYRGYSPEVDRAWKDLEIGLLDIELSSQDVQSLGYDPSTMAHWPENEGGSYMVTFEAGHLLHCVDYIRKVTYWHYDYYAARPDEDESFRHPKQTQRHADHCLEMLRQTLMCNADTTLLFFRWVAERDEPWPDFNTIHQCRNFDSLLSWSKEHESTKQSVALKPPGAAFLEVPP